MTPSNFGCSFSDLGDVNRLGWFEYQQYESRFTAHKPSKYTPAYLEESMVIHQAFLKMDDYQAHAKVIQAARDVFVNEVKSVNPLFKTLKNYIGELTKDKNELANLIKDAGQQLFDNRGVTILEDNDKLLSTMIRFIQANQAALLAKDLPSNFIGQLKDKQANLAATNKAWLDEKNASSAASDTKTIAGNEIKNRLSDMFLDARTIFVEEKEIAKKFVFDTFLAKVRGAKDAGISGKILDKVSEKAVANITVAIPALGISVVSDADGRYELSPIPEGKHDIEVKGEGFKPLLIEKRVVKPSVIGRLNIELEPM